MLTWLDIMRRNAYIHLHVYACRQIEKAVLTNMTFQPQRKMCSYLVCVSSTRPDFKTDTTLLRIWGSGMGWTRSSSRDIRSGVGTTTVGSRHHRGLQLRIRLRVRQIRRHDQDMADKCPLGLCWGDGGYWAED